MGISNEDLVRKFLDSKAINWEEIGRVIAEVGPDLAVDALYWRVVLTGPGFIRIGVLNSPDPDDLYTDLDDQGSASADE